MFWYHNHNWEYVIRNTNFQRNWHRDLGCSMMSENYEMLLKDGWIYRVYISKTPWFISTWYQDWKAKKSDVREILFVVLFYYKNSHFGQTFKARALKDLVIVLLYLAWDRSKFQLDSLCIIIFIRRISDKLNIKES